MSFFNESFIISKLFFNKKYSTIIEPNLIFKSSLFIKFSINNILLLKSISINFGFVLFICNRHFDIDSIKYILFFSSSRIE